MFEMETKEGRDIHQALGSDNCFSRSRVTGGQIIEPAICPGYCPNGCRYYSNNPGCSWYKMFKDNKISIDDLRKKLMIKDRIGEEIIEHQ